MQMGASKVIFIQIARECSPPELLVRKKCLMFIKKLLR